MNFLDKTSPRIPDPKSNKLEGSGDTDHVPGLNSSDALTTHPFRQDWSPESWELREAKEAPLCDTTSIIHISGTPCESVWTPNKSTGPNWLIVVLPSVKENDNGVKRMSKPWCGGSGCSRVNEPE